MPVGRSMKETLPPDRFATSRVPSAAMATAEKAAARVVSRQQMKRVDGITPSWLVTLSTSRNDGRRRRALPGIGIDGAATDKDELDIARQEIRPRPTRL